MFKITFIDPQSYNNLAKYDYGILSSLTDSDDEKSEIFFYCSALYDQDVPLGIDRKSIFTYNDKAGFIKPILYFLNVINLIILSVKNRSDIYHLQWVKVPLIDLIYIIFIKKVLRSKVVYTAHNVVPHNESGRRHLCLSFIYKLVDKIIVHNHSTREEIVSRFNVKVTNICVIQHGSISLNSLGAQKYFDEVCRFLEPYDLCFSFFGRGSRYKGLDILIDAWNDFKKKKSYSSCSCCLIIIGKIESELESKLIGFGNDVDVLVVNDFVPEADLYNVVEKSDVVVLPYREISQSGVLLSILGSKTPFIVSDHAGLKEPLEIADIGWVFNGSFQDLSSLFYKICYCQEELQGKVANEHGWNEVNDFYSWKNVGPKLYHLYKSMLS